MHNNLSLAYHQIVKAVVGRYMNNIFPAIDCTMEHVEGIEQLPSRHVTARRSSTVYNEHRYRQGSAKRQQMVAEAESVESIQASFW